MQENVLDADLRNQVTTVNMPSGKEFALAAVVELCCIALFFFFHFRFLFPLVIIPGIVLQFLLGRNVHDDSFESLGIMFSGLFWTCILAWVYQGQKSSQNSIDWCTTPVLYAA